MKRDFEKIQLKSGSSPEGSENLCVMEAVAYFAGEPHSDKPICACPAITEFAIRLNDWCTDDQRQRLKPYVALIAGTRDGNESARAEIFAWAAIRKFAPIALRAAGMTEHAERLEKVKTLSKAASAARAARVAADAAAADADADADAAAAAAHAAREDVFTIALETLHEAIMYGRPDASTLLAEIEKIKSTQPQEDNFRRVAVEVAKKKVC